MIHSYKTHEVSICLKSRRLVFIGDSLTRQIFWATAKKLDIEEQPQEQHTSFSFEAKGVTFEFLWDPYLNSSSLRYELSATLSSPSKDTSVDNPAILMIGGGLWYARYMEVDYFEHYKHSIEDVAKFIASHDSENHQGVETRPKNEESTVVLAPISTPLYQSLSPARAPSLTPGRIDPMNAHLQQLFRERKLPIAWSFAFMTARDAGSHQPDGLHVVESAASRMADVLLNLRCNAVLREKSAKSYPVDKTCCNSYERPNWTQGLILNGSMGLLPLLILIASRNCKGLNFLPSRQIARVTTVLALAICYCYYADRTQLFNKVQKQYSSTDFLFLCTVTAVLGVLSIRRSAAVPLQKTPHSPPLEVPDQPFLSRDQTDEWKGWMQSIILIYHYTGASKVLWIYKIIRLLVASYLFMSGFGHTMFLYKKGDYSLRRFGGVLIRLNMLSCILPYIMKTDYLFYYFAPLVSFWYIVVYITMRVGHSKNKQFTFLVTKIFISATLTSAIIRTPGVFETVFSGLSKCCNIHWDVKEWRFRLKLDSNIVFFGMLCAILFVENTHLFSVTVDKKTRQKRIRYLRVILLMLVVFGTLYYCYFALKAPDKYVYNVVVPHISFGPIIAFVMLRNGTRHTRNFYSSFFAWMGRHSLETFTLQYHIWLAADTKGLLALGMFEPFVGAKRGRQADFVVLTAIFLWVCWHVAAATQTLTSWIIDPRERGDEALADPVNGAENELPRTKSNKDMKHEHSLGQFTDGVGARFIRSASRLKTLVAGDLRIRLAIIMGVLCLLNVVS